MPTHWDAEDVPKEKWRTACEDIGAVGLSMAMSSAMGRAYEKNHELFEDTGARHGLRVHEKNVKAIAEMIHEQGIMLWDDKPLTIEHAERFVRNLIGYETYRM